MSNKTKTILETPEERELWRASWLAYFNSTGLTDREGRPLTPVDVADASVAAYRARLPPSETSEDDADRLRAFKAQVKLDALVAAVETRETALNALAAVLRKDYTNGGTPNHAVLAGSIELHADNLSVALAAAKE